MDVSQIQPGSPYENSAYTGTWTDWSHLLSPVHRRAGYKMFSRKHDQVGDAVYIFKNREYAGDLKIHPMVGPREHIGHEPPIQPDAYRLHSMVGKAHRGKGLGFRMYEAGMAHVYHLRGGRKIFGGQHSADAHRIHVKLAEKYGHSYHSMPFTTPLAANRPELKGPIYSAYQYEMKSEMNHG